MPKALDFQTYFVLAIYTGMEVANCCLDGNADAVEFCPHESYQQVLAASTYTLQEGDRPSRSGSISLFDVNASDGRLELSHRVETAGIFDIKWNPLGSSDAPLLAQADADGFLRLHRLDNSSLESEVQGTFLREVRGDRIGTSMCLCLDWNPSATSISVSSSDGSVSIISILEAKLDLAQVWKAHEFEVWATSFDIHQPHLVYTGSDDCKFCCWDLRSDPSTLAFQNTKVHNMGVTCIAKSPYDPHTILTGSYDEHLRIWDVRSISKPAEETSIGLGGGVWKIKHHPSVPGLVLAACMHNGFAIVNIKGHKPEVIETYNGHRSLAYGADWQRGYVCQGSSKKSSLVATCSFYDKLLRIWTPSSDIFT